MNETNHNTKTDFVTALNGEQTASTLDQHSLNFEPVIQASTRKQLKARYTSFVNKRIKINREGVERLLFTWAQTKNKYETAASIGLSWATVNRILTNPIYPNHEELKNRIASSKRRNDPAYLKYEREIAANVQRMNREGASIHDIYIYLRDIDFVSSQGHKARERTDQQLYSAVKDYLLCVKVDEPPPIEPAPILDQDDPTELEERLSRIARQLAAIFEISSQLIECEDVAQAYHYSQTIHGMIYKAKCDAQRYSRARSTDHSKSEAVEAKGHDRKEDRGEVER